MAWMAAAATVAASIMQSQGQEDANDANVDIQNRNSAFNAFQADANRQWQADQSQLARNFNHDEAGVQRTWQNEMAVNQMAFQERMANTQWQRGVDDMMQAGLNPMLAYSQGGASAPAGAMGQGSAASAHAPGSSPAQAGSPGNQLNKYAAAGATAGQWAQIANVQADTERKEAETEFIRTQERGYTGEQNVRVDKMRKEADLVVQQADLTNAQEKKVKEEINEVLARTKNLDADTALKKVNEVLQRHDLPRMKAEAKYFESPVGKESPHNKYGPQTPFRLFEGLGERLLNRFSAKDVQGPADHSRPGSYTPYR